MARLTPTSGAYGRPVNPADLQALRSGGLGTREAHVHLLLDRARAHGDESGAARGGLGDAAGGPALRPLLGDEADWLRQRTADALARIGGDEALEALWYEFERRRFARIGYLASTLALFTPRLLGAA